MCDTRIIKFEILIEDINNSIYEKIGGKNSFDYNEEIQNKSLLLIFDYDKMNDYAKVIARYSFVSFREEHDRSINLWNTKYGSDEFFSNVKNRIIASKEFVRYCRSVDECAPYVFIFWALMVLAVDKTDADKYLSIICDFVKMFGWEADDLQDIINVIKTIYGKGVTGYEYHNGLIEMIFEDYISR